MAAPSRSANILPLDDPRGERLLRLAAVLLLGCGLFALLPDAHLSLRLAGLLILFPAVVTLLLLRGRRLRAATHALCWGLWLALAAMAALNGGLHAPVLIGFPVVVLLMGQLLGQRAALAVSVATLTLGALFGLGEHWLPAPESYSEASLLLILALTLTATALLSFATTRSFAAQHQETRRLRDELAARVDELAARLKEMRRSEEKFSRIFHASPVTILISRFESGRYLDVNDAFEHQFGWSRDEAIGNTALDIGIWPDPQAHARWTAALRQTGKLRDYEAVLSTKFGELKQAVTAAEVFYLGETKYVITLIHDITDLRHASEEVKMLNAALEDRVRQRTADLTEANKELESFSYSISHDLRAPLRGIDGFSHLLADEYGDRLDAQGREYLDRVRRAAQRMGALIDDLLDLSRVNRHNMKRVPVDLSQIAREVMEDLKKSEPKRSVEIRIADGCSAWGDPQLLRVLMENLLGNAWKYTGKTTHAEISFGEARDAAGESTFHVRDNGIGFDMAYVDKLFLPFRRLHKTEDFAGSGVGLASAARVVRRHRGRIWAESSPGKGTSFHFTL